MKKFRTIVCLLLVFMLSAGVFPYTAAFAADAEVQSLEILENSYEYIENDTSAGMWLDDMDDDLQIVAKFSYDPYVSFTRLKLKATYTDGSSKVFSYYNEDGIVSDDIIEGDFPVIFGTGSNYFWTLGLNENAYYVEYGGVVIGVPVVVKKTDVERIEILENNYKYIKNDFAIGNFYLNDDGEEVFYYSPYESIFNLQLRVHYKDGKTSDIDFTENDGFMQLDGYSFEICYNSQETEPWTVGGDNSYTICYKSVELNVPVTVVESPVVGIQVIENPFKYTAYDERHGGYVDDVFMYDEGWSFAYCLYKIDYADGSSVYYRPGNFNGFDELDGYWFCVGEPYQWDNPWHEGENSYTLCYMGNKVVVPVTVVNNTLVDSAAKFKDVNEGKWYTQYIDRAVTYGLFNGVSETSFDPSGVMNRAMLVQVLANMSGVKTDRNAVTGFDDVPAGKWYTGAVAWAVEVGIVNGVSEKEFAPLGNVTREQMCTMLFRYAGHVGIELEEKSDKKVFADDSSISRYAKESVYACQQAGIIDGMTETEFAPKEAATRAQVAKILSVFHSDYMA